MKSCVPIKDRLHKILTKFRFLLHNFLFGTPAVLNRYRLSKHVTCVSDDFSDCCDHDEMASGCRLERSSQAGSSSGVECLCGVGCDREFQFKTLAECEAKLKCKCERRVVGFSLTFTHV